MDKNIEVEFIGSLTEGQFRNLKEKFSQEGKFLKNKKRLSVMYFRDEIPKNLEEIKDEKVDLRLRVTNGQAEVILKYGLFSGSNSREEISIPIEKNKIASYISLLRYLGWSKCVAYVTESTSYEIGMFKVTLVDIRGHGYNFEIEVLTDKNGAEKAKTNIQEFMKKLSLKSFSDEEMNSQCNEINNRKDFQFDFENQEIGEITSKFPEFFS